MSDLSVGIDVSLLDQSVRATGNRPYIRNLLSELSADDGLRLVFFGTKRSFEVLHASKGAKVEYVTLPVPFGALLARVVAQQTALAFQGLLASLDVFHGPAHALPLLLTKVVPSVVTIHDFRHLHQRNEFRWSQLAFRRAFYGSSLHAATRVIAISRNTADEAIARYGLDPHIVTVIPHGVSADFRPRPTAEVRATVDRLGLPVGYLLTTGNLRHKRPELVIESLALLSGHRKDVPALVVLGTNAERAAELDALAKAKGVKNVYQPGYVSDADLPSLYSAASALVFASSFEGFGLPLLEAMASGVPVITSASAALPEVAGDACLVLKDMTPNALAQAITTLSDVSVRARLIAAGLKRAKEYTWSGAAKKTIDVYRAAART